MTEILRQLASSVDVDKAADACEELHLNYTITRTHVVVTGEKDVDVYSLAIHEEQNNDILG